MTDLDVKAEALLLACTVRAGALATVRVGKAQGHPYVSKVGVAFDDDSSPIFLLSTLAAHTQDILADPRVSLLMEAPVTSDNPLESARATFLGTMEKLEMKIEPQLRKTYLEAHPQANQYIDFGDFSLWRLNVEKVHFVGGFGVAKWAKW